MPFGFEAKAETLSARENKARQWLQSNGWRALSLRQSFRELCENSLFHH